MKNTESLYSPRVRDIEREYQLWAKAHKRIKEGPAQDGRDYVKHAKNLLPILEALSELHPIAKAVVSGFKSVVLYEQERKENDARVSVVFLAQADMMGTLLDINQLSERRKERWDDDTKDSLHADMTLSDVLLRVEKEIRACGNSMDTYYGEKRIVKFWKSLDWKERIMNHISLFEKYRILLQQTLSVQVASDVNSLVNKMDTLLLRLFAPKADWEKDVATRTRQLTKARESKELINDTASLQTLINLTKDPLLDSKDMGEDSFPGASADFRAALPTQIEQLKKDLNLSLDTLCERNQEMFELKLNFHTRQLQEAILNSAQYVVQSLSGPYDRLHNEDLRILWKEMNWIFCVDNKLFTSALFEYYLDHFSSLRHVPNEITGEFEHKIGPSEEGEHVGENMTKVTFLSRLGVLNHVDAWTLEPMAIYGERVSLSIDRDDSGFIRISEANTFTDRMPEGWSLPQWCAYAAIGWTYEARIYRKRINNILGRMFEMQAKVLPVNRCFVAISTVPQIAPFFQLLAWEPWESSDSVSETSPVPAAELRSLVHEKMKRQDEAWRRKLQSLNWTVEDETTLQLLYGKEPLESYVLQLSVLLLEYAYQVMQACTKVTVDAQEINHVLAPLRLLKRLSLSRVKGLKAQFKKEKKSKKYIGTFYGGIWDCVNQVSMGDVTDDDEDSDTDDENSDSEERSSNNSSADTRDSDADSDNDKPFSLPFEPIDIDDFAYDESVLEEFSLPLLADGCLPYLKYRPWEEHIRNLPEKDIPEEIPNTWNLDRQQVADEDDEDHGSRHDWAAFPLTFRNCNMCNKAPMTECYYGCTVCNDLDICSECYKIPIEDDEPSGHRSSHPVLRFSLHTVGIHRDWIILDAQVQIEEIRDNLRAIEWNQTLGNDDDPDDERTGGDEDDAETDRHGDTDNTSDDVHSDGDAAEDLRPRDSDDGDADAADTTFEDNAIDEPTDDANEENEVESPYTCSHCQQIILLDDVTTFYKCFRHSCRDYWVCETCADQQFTDDNPDGHEWWHSLIVLRREILVDADETVPEKKASKALNVEATDKKKRNAVSPDAIVAAIGNRISAVEEKLDGTNSMLQDTLSLLLKDRIQVTSDNFDSKPQFSNRALEERMSNLEDKVDMMVAELRNFFTSFNTTRH
ncbi:hypothetical protein HYPSUDRAFT_66143 [Hypholoma sublateritium FD-334 SS-4]|uniref:ZZ-type domain-containing protein n=1 Tax=Hypholoma sublateritium (strain FD-334 SS-4) TaxID=945553 RepID=A0A0D2L989_HYPSF|nr:hypothetical protein HYPSUDRAFT_66143 [Hypholoma sublateritium FD-334 SS-4]